MRLLRIGPLVCPRAALDGGFAVAGLPSITAVAGWVDALCRAAGRPALNPPFALVLHDVQPHLGVAKPSPDEKAQPTEAVERLHGRVTASVVVADPQAELSVRDIAHAARRMRFCGSLPEAPRGVRVREADTLQAALLGLPPGHIVADRTDLLAAARGPETDPLDALLDVLARPGDAAPNPWSRAPDGTPRQLVPLAVGYQLLEPVDPARTRAGTRCQETPHAFAEAVVGLGELLSARKLARTAAPLDTPPFWSWRHDAANSLLILAGSPATDLPQPEAGGTGPTATDTPA